ncbi:MAG TPA: hypothetical protein VLL05_15690 [Terriglobales bacterium]|nr:hypothetical protein [Terriglobales bacterium]
MDTLRSGVRVIGSALMNSEMVYSFLMGIGWFFLLGWAVALVVACASVFRQDYGVRFAGLPDKLPNRSLLKRRVG